MDAVGAAIRIGRRYHPRLAAEADWLRQRSNQPMLRAVDQLVQRGNTVVDIGASRGDFTARLLRLVGRRGEVHAFEPNPSTAAELRRMQRRANLRVHSCALSSERGVATLRVPVLEGTPNKGLGSLETPGAKADIPTEVVEVQKTRLVDALPALERLDFVKCDVEGHERAVLAGALPLLERHHPSVLIEIEQRHQDGDVSETFELFDRLGYSGWAFFRQGLRPLEEFDLERDQLRFVPANPTDERISREYVHNFLFVMPEVAIPAADLAA